MKAVCLARYPVGNPVPEDFLLTELPEPAPGDGDALVAVTHLSMDPMPRLRMQDRPPLGPPMAIGKTVEGRGVGRVLESRAPGLAVGDWVVGELGWQQRSVLPAEKLVKVAGGQPHQHLNALGATGLAAYFVVETLDPCADLTMLVAPAAGAVGSLVCQIARHVAPELRLVGTARDAGQAAFLEGIGVLPMPGDAEWPLDSGIDLFVDGIGGDFHDRMLPNLNARARVLLLGFMSGYGAAEAPRYGNAGAILMKRASMEGFLLADHMGRADKARARLQGWLDNGAIRPAETLHQGLASAPHAFAGLFANSPPGKQIVELEDR